MRNTKLNLYPKNLPSLESGTYEIKITQELKINGENNETYQNTSTYKVESSGFDIDNQIEQIFPANGSTGQYSSFIPQVTFSNKTLPWEKGETPWLALLILHEGEEFSFKLDSNLDKDSPSNYYNKKVLGKLQNEKFSLVELPIGLFQIIAPKINELKFLAHVREVTLCNSQSVQYLQHKGLQSTENNAPASSVILSNRLPKHGLNTMVLVSTDGLKENLGEKTDDHLIQLIVLKKWSFVCNEKEESFSSYLKENIKAGDFKLEYNKDIGVDAIKNIIDQGFVPLKNNASNEKVEFYRGPLIPIFQNQNTIEYTEENPAYQLGRLLCLQNKSIAEAIFNNRVNNFRIATLQYEMNKQEVNLNKNSIKLKGSSNKNLTSKELQLDKLTDLLKTFNSSKTL